VDLEDPTRSPDAYIPLQQNDFVFVDRSSSVTLQEVLSYVSTVAVLITAGLTIAAQTK
jgi:hypothetical protein